MSSPIVHLTAGYVVSRFFNRGGGARWKPAGTGRWKILLWCSVFSMLPDFDAVLGVAFGDFGRYHNNITHSLLPGIGIAVLTSFVLLALLKPKQPLSWVVLAVVCYALHILLDYFTYGRGVMLFWPLTGERFISPVPVFRGVQWALGVWNTAHIRTVLSDLVISALAVGLILLFTRRTPPTGDREEDRC